MTQGLWPRTSRRTLLAGASLLVLLGASPSAGQELTLWSGYPELAPFYEHVAEGLKAKYPDLKFTVEAIALREHEKRVALGLTSGGAADILELAASNAARYLENGLLREPPEDVAQFVRANFDQYFIDNAGYQDVIYSVPLFRGQSALYYNTDMFAAAGLTEPPATMADFTTHAEKLTQRDASGNPTVSGWSMRLSGGGAGIAEKFWINMFQYGGNLLEQSADGKWKATFASEAGREALKQYLDNVHVKKNVTVEMPADAEAFERGQTAMFIRESWVIGDIAAKAPDLKYATAPLPVGSIVAPANLYVTTDDADTRAAWDYILATAEPENQLWLLDNVGWLPNRAGLDYSELLARKPALAAYVEYPENYKFFSLPSIGPIEEVLATVAARLQEAFANPALAGDDAAIDAFLKEAAAEVDAILEREGLLAG